MSSLEGGACSHFETRPRWIQEPCPCPPAPLPTFSPQPNWPSVGQLPPLLFHACWEPAPTALAENVPDPKVPPHACTRLCSPHSTAHRIPQDALLYLALTSWPRPSTQTSVLRENPLLELCTQQAPNKAQVMKVAWLLPEVWEHDAQAHRPV